MSDPAANEEICRAAARFLEAEGVPRHGGRLFGVLLLSSGPLSLDHLTTAAGISKASASTNARLLERLGLVERVSPPGDRRDHYQIAGSGVNAPLTVVAGRLRALRDVYALAASSESPAAPDLRNRLRLDISFLDHLLETLEELAGQWAARTRAQGD